LSATERLGFEWQLSLKWLSVHALAANDSSPPFATDAADFIKGKVGRKPINRRFLIVSPFLLARLPLDH